MKNLILITLTITFASTSYAAPTATAKRNSLNPLKKAKQFIALVQFMDRLEAQNKEKVVLNFEFISSAFAAAGDVCILAGYEGHLDNYNQCKPAKGQKIRNASGEVICNPGIFGEDLTITPEKGNTRWTRSCAQAFLGKYIGAEKRLEDLNEDDKIALGKAVTAQNLDLQSAYNGLNALCDNAKASFGTKKHPNKTEDRKDCEALRVAFNPDKLPVISESDNGFDEAEKVATKANESSEETVNKVEETEFNKEIGIKPNLQNWKERDKTFISALGATEVKEIEASCPATTTQALSPTVAETLKAPAAAIAVKTDYTFDEKTSKACEIGKEEYWTRWKEIIETSKTGLPCYEKSFRLRAQEELSAALSKSEVPPRQFDKPYEVLKNFRLHKCEVNVRFIGASSAACKHQDAATGRMVGNCVEITYTQKPEYGGTDKSVTLPFLENEEFFSENPLMGRHGFYKKLIKGDINPNFSVMNSQQPSSVTPKQDFVRQIAQDAYAHCSDEAGRTPAAASKPAEKIEK